MVVEIVCAASLYPSRAVDDTAAQQDRTARDEGAIPAVNCVALRCRMPHLPLLPLWEKGAGGGIRGKSASERIGRHCGAKPACAGESG